MFWSCSTFGLGLSAAPGQSQEFADQDTTSQAAAPAAGQSASPADAATPAPAADPNAANNPLTPKITLNFHEYYIPQLEGVPDREANSFLFRGVIPHKTFGVGQLFRYTLPVVTTPTFPGGSKTGVGDLTLIDLVAMPFSTKTAEFVVGPVLVLPTARDDLGAGKWQAGVSAVAIFPRKWGLMGAVATYQHSFAGDDDRPTAQSMTFQPLVIYNLPDAFYLRSSGTWSFDLERANDYVPVGFGFGKVWQASEVTTVNAFIEPQYTVWSNGIGMPKWQILAGINLQFALNR
ncbi:hypothetical protein AB3M93_07120 [Novosphingobium panipatense]|uniref:Outer membrane beta-barrel porin/alpha-amylase n=2 Tax=Novosphingobium panipatense TaxID=428991 RepID=A0ABY1Q4V6_9SPHN|nr:hypothetical protein [Novosphingobium panipatense]SMP55597.1 hypothetical protein SAMN06296065_1025 [Novosphingobium panipatense]